MPAIAAWRAGLFTAITAALATVAACSSSSTANTPAPSSSRSGASASAGTVSAAQYLTSPTALPVATPVSKPIPRGLKIVYLSAGVPQAITYLKGITAAAAVLGWKVSSMTYDQNNPATITSAIQSAIAEKPDAIVLDALLTQSFANEIPAATAAHIPLFPIVSPDKPQADVYPVLKSDVEQGYAARILTDALLADAAKAGKTAHVLEITVPAFATVLAPEDNGVKAELAAKCPACTQSLINIALPDVFNGNYTQQVVSYLQSHPQINYIVSDAGQLEDGLGAALQQAGITGVVRYGMSPTNVQIQELQSGQPGAWAVQPYQVGGWQVVDNIARQHIGDPTNLWDSEHLSYILTSANAKYVNPADPEFPVGYQGMFQKLWGK